MRYRKGPRGLYYTDGKLDNNYYNDMFAPYWERLIMSVRCLADDIPDLIDYLWNGLQGLFYLIILPIIPFIRMYNAKKYAKEHYSKKYAEKPNYPRDYYEVLDE